MIAGYDELNPSTAAVPVADYSSGCKEQVSKLRLGLPRTPFFEGLDSQIAKATDTAIEVLQKLTTTVREITLPETSIPVDEIYAKLRSVEAYAYHRQWISDSQEKYQPATRQRIIDNAAQVKAADYAQARLEVDILRREIKKVYSSGRSGDAYTAEPTGPDRRRVQSRSCQHSQHVAL